MTNSISIQYPSETQVEIKLNYSIELAGNMQTISCCVDEKHFPSWLQLRKFNLWSLKKKDSYEPLFNEINNSKNIDTALFIDQAYSDIMRAEKFKILTSASKN